MSLVVVGLNHESCPLEVRERLAFSANRLPAAYQRLAAAVPEAGAVILSTCNRVEVYLSLVDSGLSASAAVERATAFLGAFHGAAPECFRDYLYVLEDDAVPPHLFRVASGLDSLVVGETQILGQVHDAYLAARAADSVDKVLNGLFQRAFSVAKAVRTDTAIGEGKVSVSSVAVDLAVSIFGDLAARTVFVIGSGDMAGLTLRHLVEHGAQRIAVANRDAARATRLAEPYGGEAIPFDALAERLHEADIIVSSTAAPGFILDRGDFVAALRRRAHRPMFAIDIAVPRDIDPNVATLDNVYLCDVDGLQKSAQANLEARRREFDRALEIVERKAAGCCEWLRRLSVEPAITGMTKKLDAIRERELARTFAELPDLTDAERDAIRRMSDRLVRRILDRPIAHFKHEATREDPSALVHLARRLFGLDEAR